MPVILPAIGAVISAAGAAYGVEQSQAAQSKMNQDTANVANQEQQLQRKATPIFQQNLTKVTSPQPAQQGIADALGQYQKVAAAPISTQPVTSAPDSKTVDARTQAGIARSQQASAALQAYPAQNTAFGVGNANANAQLGNISQIGSSIASTLPANLALAQSQGQTGQAVGGLIGSAGQLAGTYGSAQNSNASNQALLNALKGAGSAQANPNPGYGGSVPLD